ncbi:MAG: winged helix-turn-helix domain-containing protein [Candidatus Sericytochromatia bacterium]|nr:winged helix-turn-helix domain-containing protein [Candidatus Tanganyikabacteria bacterium]
MQDIVSRLSVAAFAVDDDLRVVAWNQAAEGGGGVTASEALGQFCYDVIPAIDLETGRPCHETCPLRADSHRRGWAHNRALRAPWEGERWVRLQCFAVKAALSDTEQGNICVLEPPEDSILEHQGRVMSLIEALYPVLESEAAPASAVHSALAAGLPMARADCAELYLRQPDGRLVSAIHAGACPPGTHAVAADVAASLAGGATDSPQLLIAENGAPGDGGWTICAPVVARGRVAAMIALSSRQLAFDIAAAARVLFPLSVHLAGLVPGLLQESMAAPAPAADAPPALAVRCLGAFEIAVDGTTLPHGAFKRQKAVKALQYLVAHRGRPVSRESLMELLWPGANPQLAARNLRVILHDLRRALDLARNGRDFVHSSGESVVLEGGTIWVDAEEFVGAVREAESFERSGRGDLALGSSARALDLYCGDFLAGDASSGWALIAREQLRELFFSAARLAIRQHSRRGELTAAMAVCWRGLELEPSREELHYSLITLLRDAGRRDDALRQYQACWRVLRRDLGVAPGPDLEALHETLTHC